MPRYRQGSFDSLCAYYTGSMMLATLFPEYRDEFGRAKSRAVRYMSLDPLMGISHRLNDDHRMILSRWFYFGEFIETVVEILNTVMARKDEATRFECQHLDTGEKTYEKMVDSIDQGLPVMLGWDTNDYGCHAVLVRGYWIGKERWLMINDPGGGNQEVSWDSLKAQQQVGGRFEVGLCTEHGGPRPLKSVSEGEAPVVYQWTPEQEYVGVKGLFAG